MNPKKLFNRAIALKDRLVDELPDKRWFIFLRGLAFFLFVAALAYAIIYSTVTHIDDQPQDSQATSQYDDRPPTRAGLLKLVNAERAKHGVAPLKEDPRLDHSAQEKANDEEDHDYFGHERPGSSDFIGADFINATGIWCVYESENLVTDISSSSAVEAWINSPPHHQAMIDPRYTLTGFGFTKDGSYAGTGYQIVEHFCQTP